MVERALSQHVPVLIIDGMFANLARHAVLVADAHLTVGIEIGKRTRLHTIDKIALIHLRTLLVGLEPMALTASLFVNLILCLAGQTCHQKH